MDIGAFEFVHPTADTDGDGMPDAWEISQGLNPTVADGGEDADGDGSSNYEEFVAGTSPKDRTSTLQVEIELLSDGTHLSLRWPSVLGRIYTVRSANDPLVAPPWPALPNNLIGTGGILERIVPLVTTWNRFYQVEVTLP